MTTDQIAIVIFGLIVAFGLGWVANYRGEP
jgi:hypothetical protein